MTAEEIQSAYEWETGSVIVELFKHVSPMEVCAVLVNSLGPFVWRPTGKKAVKNALALEIVAEMALKAIQAQRSGAANLESPAGKAFSE